MIHSAIDAAPSASRRKRTVYPLPRKVVLITGAGGGLGGSLAEVLVERGACVTLVDIDGSAAQRVAAALPASQSLALSGDVTDIESMRSAVSRTVDQFGRLDVAIANAGILGRAATFRTLSPEEVQRVLSVNVAGVVNTASAATQSVIANRGQIVVISSVFAFMNGAGAIPYAMSKAAVSQLGLGLAVELAPHGASAMTAYFALLETELIRQGIDAHPDALGVLETATPRALRRRLPPRAAAVAIADGMEARARRLLLLHLLRPITSMHGLLAPIVERRTIRNSEHRAALMKLEQSGAVQRPVAQPT